MDMGINGSGHYIFAGYVPDYRTFRSQIRTYGGNLFSFYGHVGLLDPFGGDNPPALQQEVHFNPSPKSRVLPEMYLLVGI
jgi:hypothetical protein